MTSAPPRDVFQRVNELDAATVQRLVDRMETRRRDPTFSAWREAYLDRLDLAAAGTVLELGCGSGAVARATHHHKRLELRLRPFDRPGTRDPSG